MQFIFTTHSPLVVATLERANLYIVERQDNGYPGVARPIDETFGLTADQILRSEVFGLDSTRDPEFRERLTRISAEALSGKPGAALQLMREAAMGKGAAAVTESAPAWLKNLKSKA